MTTNNVSIIGVIKDYLMTNSELSRLALADLFEEAGDLEAAKLLREASYCAFSAPMDEEAIDYYEGEGKTAEDAAKTDRFYTAAERDAFVDGVNAYNRMDGYVAYKSWETMLIGAYEDNNWHKKEEEEEEETDVCHACGSPCVEYDDGTTRHLLDDGVNVAYDLDEDHTAIPSRLMADP